MLEFVFSPYAAAQAVTGVSAGANHSLFVKSDGSLWGMGDNSYGQLGLGFGLSQTNLPQEIVSSNVTAVAAGGDHSLFLEPGSLWAMGQNYHGELGDGTTVNHYFPEQIVSSGGAPPIAAGLNYSLYTTRVVRYGIFSLWGMGQNSDGQLGDGTETSRDSPEEIQSTELAGYIVTALACGSVHSLYVREDGSLWGAGSNGTGQLGEGTQANSLNFEEIVSNNVVAVAAGPYHSLFIKSGGGLWAMGEDLHGQLGDNSFTLQTSPEQVGVNVTAIAAGSDFSLFIKSDGSLWGMGGNAFGQLGDGTTTDRHLPVQIVPSNVVVVAAGDYHSLFIKSDGSLWAMGDNSSGQLGDGTYTTRLSPVQVVPLPPVITGISLAGGNLVLNAANGISGHTYYTLSSTNLSQPFNQWTPVATNSLTAGGAFTIIVTNAVAPQIAYRFFVLQMQ